jgi:glycosyltransferase involved in cell wall biosynthesis
VSGSAADRVAIVIPALNEAAAIRGVAQAALAVCPTVILVDDGSTDATLANVADLPLVLVRHDRPRGKGAALRAGFRQALALRCSAVVTMDGDGQHDAADVPRLLAAARDYPGHIIIGARLLERQQQPAHRRRANDMADWGVGWACGQAVVDSQSGQRYYPRAVLEVADRAGEGFVFETDLLIEASRALGLGIAAVPIRSRYHADFRASHFKAVPDFLRIAGHVGWQIVRRGGVWRSLRKARRHPALVVGAASADLVEAPAGAGKA